MHVHLNCTILLQLHNLLVQMLMKCFSACFNSQDRLNESFTAKCHIQVCYSPRVVWTLLPMCPSKGRMQRGLQMMPLASVKGQNDTVSLCEMKETFALKSL